MAVFSICVAKICLMWLGVGAHVGEGSGEIDVKIFTEENGENFKIYILTIFRIRMEKLLELVKKFQKCQEK